MILALAACSASSGHAGGLVSDLASVGGQLEPRSTGPEVLLVGVIVAGSEVGAMELVRRDGEFLIPLEELAALTGARSESTEDGGIVVVTSLGEVIFDRDELDWINGAGHVRERDVEDRLSTPVDFDMEAFAVRFDVPWPPLHEPTVRPEIRVDVEPPAASLSGIRVETRHTTGSGVDSTRSSAVVVGRLLGGRWRARARHLTTLDDPWGLEEYAWAKTYQKHIVLAGSSYAQVHPMLTGFDLAGVQAAWTNRPSVLFAGELETYRLQPRQLQPVSTFRGPGPAGGLAELRIDGRVIERQIIPLSGLWEFIDVPIPSQQLASIQVFVYDRTSPGTPVDVFDYDRSASRHMLPNGMMVHHGGVGLDRNPLDPANDVGERRLGGFYSFRSALSENVTVEAGGQLVDGREQVLISTIARILPGLIVSAATASSSGEVGGDLTIEGYHADWRFYGRSRWLADGFLSTDSDESTDQYAELGWRASRQLDFSVVGRYRSLGGSITEYVLPAMWWDSGRGFSVRIEPDSVGDYLANLRWRIDRTTRFDLLVREDDELHAEVSRSVSPELRVAGRMEDGETRATSFEAELEWLPRRWRGKTRLAGGTIFSQGAVGYRARGQAQLMPGFLLTFDVEEDPSRDGLEEETYRRALLGLTVDLAVAGGRLLPAENLSLRTSRGGVAGRVFLESDSSVAFSDVVIGIRSGPDSTTASDGSYFIGNVRPGVYLLELQPEKLPIELVPVKPRLVVEVAAGAVTRADFAVRLQVGIAGRVTDRDGRKLDGIRVELIDESGERAGSAVTDQFGLYRIDGLGVGEYTLRVADDSLPGGLSESPARRVVIVDQFLFDQSLELPVTLPAQP